jgi:hypothetical protein
VTLPCTRPLTHTTCAPRAANSDSVPSGALVHLVLPVAVWSCGASSDAGDDSNSESGCESGSDSEEQPLGRETPEDYPQRVSANCEAQLVAAALRSRAIPRAQVLCYTRFEGAGVG